ncbi:elongation factor 1-beta [Trichonephila clavipes]|nr:elongation factor 1-beta [Trichonephila clavipes]
MPPCQLIWILPLKINTSKHQSGLPVQNKLNVNGPAEDDDDDIDLFGSDEETDEDKRIKEERLKAYENKKAKKPALVAKSSVVLDIKPWSDETDMKEIEITVRKIAMDGLTWGASKLVPLAYGIRKLQIIAIVEDDKVSVDGLQESIEEIEDLVQSVDIAAFNKL